jgi:hypothetical protein
MGHAVIISDELVSRELGEAFRQAGFMTAYAPGDAVIIGGTKRAVVVEALLSCAFEPEIADTRSAPQKYGNPRPYLKRKKGRT